MSLLELLDELRQRGVRLRAEEGKLKFSGPKGGLTEELRARVAAERGALLALLGAQQEPDGGPAPQAAGPPDGPAPLSHAQQRLWIVEQIEGIGTAYAIPGAAEIEGALDPVALERALAAVMRRQASLRTALRLVGSQPRQIVEPDPPLPFEVEDLSGEADPETTARARLATLAAAPFDLGRAPLFRARLLRLAPERHLFGVVLHHAIADGWSITLLLRELGTAYAQAAVGRNPETQPLVPSYADLARRERGPEGQARIERQLGYWVERLAGAPELLELPTDRPRPPVQSFRGAAARAVLPAGTVAGLRTLAQGEGATLFMALFAIFAVLVARHSGERDFVLGTPVAGRESPESQRLVGLFVNTLALRCDLSGRPSFRTLLGRVRRTVLEAFDHQDVPFERLVDALRLARDPRYPPLCQVLFALQSALDERLDLAGAKLTPLPIETGGSRVDLFLAAETRDDGGLGFEAEYCSDLFEAARIERLLGHFVRLAAAAVERPDAPVERLRMLDPAERRQLLSEGKRTAPLAEPLTLPGRFAAIAANRPDAVAVEFGDARQSYADLQGASGRIAAALGAAGVRPGEVVGLRLPRCLLLPAALLGILRAGSAYLPLEPDLPAARRRALLSDAGVRVVLSAEDLLADLADDGPHCLAVERAVRFEGEAPTAPKALAPDGLAYVIYTSGSTGGPKGVCVTHRNVLRLVDGIDYDGPPPACFLQVCSIAFDVSTFEIWGALLSGARLAIPPAGPLEPAVLRDSIERHGVEALWLTAGLFHRMAESLPDTLAGVRYLLAGGDVVQPAAAQAILDRMAALGHQDHRFGNGYGPTECTTFATLHWMRPGERLGASVPIGRAIGNTALYVVDGEGEPVPLGVPGELWLGGLGVAQGYLGRPDLTAERFRPDPFTGSGRVYRTGDRVRWLADGTLEFLGRLDQQVKLRGFRIEPGEIEQALLDQPGVAEAVVVVQLAPSGAKQLVGYLVAEPAAAPDVSTLREALATRLPAYMVPAHLSLLERLPLNRSGKVDRRALPAPSEDGETAPSRSPEGPAEEAIAAIWRDLLKRDTVGAEDNFFALGGDSILAMQVVLRAGEAGIAIGLRDLLERQTVAGLAAAASAAGRRKERAASGPAAVPAVAGPLPLTPVQRWFFDRRLARPAHWNQAVLLSPRSPLDPERLQAGLDALVARHEALRQRFPGAGTERHVTIAPAQPVPLEVHRVRSEAEMAARAETLQASLDLVDGPLLRAALFRQAEGGERLLLVAHHLAVDAVSWHVMLHELARFLETGALPGDPPPTPWSAYAVQAPAMPRPQAEPANPLPCDLTGGENEEATAARAECLLGPAETEAFLGPANEALRSQPTELLVAALSAALLDWSGGAALTVEVERHGRDVLPELDLSQTVGWLTRLDPRRVERPAADAPEAWLAAARGASGVGDTGERAEVALNYFGRLDGSAEGLLVPAEGPVGALYGPGAERRHFFELIAEVTGGRLRLALRYSPTRHRRETAAALVEAVGRRLEAIVAWATLPANGGLLPVDVPLAGLDQRRLDRLLARLPTERGRHAARDVETILPLSPQQQGMLLDSLADPGSGMHHEQLTIRLEGELDPALLRDAWRQAAERHEILRTGFVWQGLAQPLQVVFRRARLDWTECHGEPDVAWLRQDRLAGFDLARPGTFRLTLWRSAGDDWRLVWTFHHLLLDGWSTALLLREVMTLYEAGRQRRPAALPPALPYGAYVAWLAGRDQAATAAFWRAELAELPAAPPLAFAGAEPAPAGERYGERLARLDRATDEALAKAAQRLAVTPGTLLQGAWALLLAGLLRRDALIFGATSAGRPEELTGCETSAGLFIDTLPVSVEVPRTGALAEWLAGLFARYRRILAHPHLGAGALQRAAGLTSDRALFETLLVYENYPQDLRAAGEARENGGLKVAELASCGARTRYPLTLLAVPDAGLRLQLVFDRRRLPEDLAARLIALLCRLLKRLADGETRIEALRTLVAEADLPAPDPGVVKVPPAAPHPNAEAQTALERALAEIWGDLLGCAEVPADRSFFELGGHSLLALEMAAAVERRLGLTVDAGVLLRAPTLRGLAAALTRVDLPGDSPLVTLAEGEGAPLVVVPGASGNPLAYLPLARRMDGRKVLGVQLAGLSAAGTVEATAARLAELLPDGPLHLLGHSFGAALAYETARRLAAEGRPARLVALLDLAAPQAEAPPLQGPPPEAELLAEIADAAARYFDRPVNPDRKRLAGPKGRHAFLAALAEAGLVSGGADETLVDTLLELYRSSLAALAAWRPGPLAGPVTVLRARDSETTGGSTEPDLGWSRWTAVEACHSLPGDHIGLIRDPWLAGLADCLHSALAAHERSPETIAPCA